MVSKGNPPQWPGFRLVKDCNLPIIYIYIYMCVCVCMYIHKYIYIYTHNMLICGILWYIINDNYVSIVAYDERTDERAERMDSCCLFLKALF